MDQVPIHLHIEPLEEGGFVATSPDVPGLVAEGETIAEMIDNVREVTRLIIESCVANGFPLPPALVKNQAPRAMDVFVPVEAA
ncbi:MAG TPA: type II toxin-antitoxin system HicB family antitoxin [Tepidisphaeraceae bacterium]|jgi:predicted RNase H-like HicB family nuclease